MRFDLSKSTKECHSEGVEGSRGIKQSPDPSSAQAPSRDDKYNGIVNLGC